MPLNAERWNEAAGSPTKTTTPAPRRVGEPVKNPAPETGRLYRADWAGFLAWCRVHHHVSLPAMPVTVAAYLMEASASAGRPIIARRKAAIAAMHRAHGLPVPTLDRAALAGLRQAARNRPAVARQAARPTPAQWSRLANACPGDLAGLRDRALLLLAAATARDPGAAGSGVPVAHLLLLDAEDVRFEAGWVALTLRTRDGEEALLRTVRVARGTSAASCPARVLEDWLRASGTKFGPVFRKVDRWGNAEHTRLGPDGLRRIVQRREAGGRGRVAKAPDRGRP